MLARIGVAAGHGQRGFVHHLAPVGLQRDVGGHGGIEVVGCLDGGTVGHVIPSGELVALGSGRGVGSRGRAAVGHGLRLDVRAVAVHVEGHGPVAFAPEGCHDEIAAHGDAGPRLILRCAYLPAVEHLALIRGGEGTLGQLVGRAHSLDHVVHRARAAIGDKGNGAGRHDGLVADVVGGGFGVGALQHKVAAEGHRATVAVGIDGIRGPGPAEAHRAAAFFISRANAFASALADGSDVAASNDDGSCIAPATSTDAGCTIECVFVIATLGMNRATANGNRTARTISAAATDTCCGVI